MIANGHGIRTILFDLDGTLADTAPDLADALNATLIAYGHDPLDFTTIRPCVSHGARALLQLGFNIQSGDAGFDERRRFLLDYYAAHIADKTRLFPGMETVLDMIETHGMNWGIVTNKPAYLTERLLDQLTLLHRAATVVSGDTLIEKKPHPLPMLHACREAGSKPQECLYVGDAERDIIAGRSAGMYTLVTLFGYISYDDAPETWGADASVTDPGKLLDVIEDLASKQAILEQ